MQAIPSRSRVASFSHFADPRQANVVNTVGIGWQSYLSYSNHVREYEYKRKVPHHVVIDKIDGVQDNRLTLPSEGGFGFGTASPVPSVAEGTAGEGRGEGNGSA